LAQSIFRDALDLRAVTVRRRKWFPLQPRNVVMAPTGHIHVHPHGNLWSEDYACDPVPMQALFLHEMTHVWQTQTRGQLYLPLMRHPFCRYRYMLKTGFAFTDYGLEQQAEIVRHIFMLRNGLRVPGAPTLSELEPLLPF
jgi:hypothetical protein